MCPICTVGVAAGLGLSRWLKIDDAISGIWVGALILAMAIWTWRWLYKKRNKNTFVGYAVLAVLVIGWGLLTFIPLHYAGILDSGCKTILGMNRLVFGSLIGLIISAGGIYLERFLRVKKQGRAWFPYQKVIVPIAVLIIASLIMAAYCI